MYRPIQDAVRKLAVLLLVVVPISLSAQSARCHDGSLSYSATRSGTCSRHGGVAEWLPTTALPPAQVGTTTPPPPAPKAAAGVVARDARGRIQRSAAARHAFARQTGYPNGRPGYVIDHIIPLACGGADAPRNMQWQTIAAAKDKDRWERKGC